MRFDDIEKCEQKGTWVQGLQAKPKLKPKLKNA